MHLTDADALIAALEVDPIECPGCPEPEFLPEIIELLREAPTIDAVPVVRCRDCKWSDWYTGFDGKVYCACMYTQISGLREMDYCSRGERDCKEGDGE